MSFKVIKLNILVVLAVLVVLLLPKLPVQAAANDILVYYTYTFYPADIFVTDLANIGYNVNIVARPAVIPPGGHLGITPADPVNLLNYGQVWIIGGAHGVDFLPVEISAIKAFRDAPNNGGLLLSGENGPAFGETINERINQITSEYNNGTDLFHGCIRVNSSCNNFPLFTWGGHPIIHPLYIGLTFLSSSNSDAELNIQNINIEVTTRSKDILDSIIKDYGAVLDDGLGGRIIFDTSWWRFIRSNNDCTICCQSCPWPTFDCSAEQESIYQQNIAQWLVPICVWQNDNCGDAPCSASDMHQTCGPIGCVGNCAGGFVQGDTQCVLDPINCVVCVWQNDNCGDAPCSVMEMHQTCGSPGCVGNCSGGFVEGDTKCVIDPISCGAVCGDGSCDFPETSVVDFGFEILCMEDCGCDNDTFCEAERGENFWNCALDCPLVAGIDCLCKEQAEHSKGNGLVPCGRNFDDRDTDYICECCPCTFCHTFLLMKRITDFAVKQGLPALLVLTVVVAGVLYLVGGFSGSLISQAHGIFKIIGIGTAIVFAGWVVINLTLYVITGKETDAGVAKVFAGRWDEITCDYGKTCTTADCGDGIVQRPNFNGLDEECEIDERWEGFKARAKAVPPEAIDIDGTVNPVYEIAPGTNLDGNDYWGSLCSCEGCVISGSADACCNNWRLDYGEECDQTVPEAVWLASPYVFQDADGDGWQDGDLDQDGDIDSDDYYLSICRCEEDCTYGVEEILDTFHDSSNVFTLNIPVGGSDSSAHIRLPVDTKVCTTSLEIDFTGPTIEKTPYLWVPLSDRDRLVQIDTDNEEFVAMYGKEDGVITCASGTYCIWDCTANCAANNPTWTERGEDTDCNFDNPSRITVILDQQVWVANRDGGSVTQLIRTNGNFECKGTYSDIGGGSGPRGVTFDVEGNIWVGAYSTDRVCKYQPDGTLLFCRNIGCRTYGMIADSYGNVWTSDIVNNRVCRIDISNCHVGSCPISTTAVGDIYGIGMDNEGDIWIGRHGSAEVYEIDGGDSDGNPIGSITESCGALPVITGIAVDGDNNVWGSNHNGDTAYMIEGGDCTKIHSFANVCPLRNLPHGVAIDGDNNAWVVCRRGEVIKLKFDGVNIVKILDRDLNTACNSGTGSSASYNYSDMTGFRTAGLSLCVGATCFPISTNIALSGFEKELQAALAGCSGGVPVACDARFSPPHTNCCDVPMEIKAVLGGGQYDLYNLNIKYNPSE